jgi:hypothetical protein
MRKISDLTIAAVKRGYLAGDTIAALAKQHGISEGSIKRLAKAGDWAAIRQAKQQAIQAAVQQPPAVSIAGAAIDFDDLLTAAIASLSADVAALPGKSKESAATALFKAIELYRKYHPLTMDELADLAIALPDFDPAEFARRLRDRYTAAQANQR